MRFFFFLSSCVVGLLILKRGIEGAKECDVLVSFDQSSHKEKRRITK